MISARQSIDRTAQPERARGRAGVGTPVGGERGAIGYVAVGANLGDRLTTLRTAVDALDAHPGIEVDRDRGVSSLYETTPVGAPDRQPNYLNAVVRLTTTLSPLDLLEALQAIETRLGRVRGRANAARSIDLDVVLLGGLVLNDDRLIVPHPRMHERRFVLEPLREIAPREQHPVLSLTIDELAAGARTAHAGDRIARVAGPEWRRDGTRIAAHVEHRR
jgi:2-amino-4-hydroxy-6-hydroxymethyldihydropteridine diphosphokinase